MNFESRNTTARYVKGSAKRQSHCTYLSISGLKRTILLLINLEGGCVKGGLAVVRCRAISEDGVQHPKLDAFFRLLLK